MCVYVYVYIYIYIRTYTCAYTRVSMPAEKLYTSKDALAVKERESAAIGRIQADRVGAGTLCFRFCLCEVYGIRAFVVVGFKGLVLPELALWVSSSGC